VCVAVARVVADHMIEHETPLDGFPHVRMDRSGEDSFEITMTLSDSSSKVSLSNVEVVAAQKAAVQGEVFPDVFTHKVVAALVELEARVR